MRFNSSFWGDDRRSRGAITIKKCGKSLAISGNRCHARARKHSLTDEQLAERLAQYAPLKDSDFPDLCKSDYDYYVRSTSGRISKELEKWL